MRFGDIRAWVLLELFEQQLIAHSNVTRSRGHRHRVTALMCERGHHIADFHAVGICEPAAQGSPTQFAHLYLLMNNVSLFPQKAAGVGVVHTVLVNAIQLALHALQIRLVQ